MFSQPIKRRSFLRLAAASLGALAFRSRNPLGSALDPGEIGRVAWARWNAKDHRFVASVYSEPDDKSQILYPLYRDEVINLYYPVVSISGPGYNPLWYRIWRGYIHSAHIIKVNYRLNQPLASLPEKGMLVEITVPHTQSYRHNYLTGWQPAYRLYYESAHWVIAIESGLDGQPWYRIKEDYGGNEYLVPAEHCRHIPATELTPISADVPPGDKRIEVSIAGQMVTAYERDKIVLQTKVSTGYPTVVRGPGKIPTDTPTGSFRVELKTTSRHMGEGNPNANPDDPNMYELPGVPWVSFFEPKTGVAMHGTYWHNNFGLQMSHGCVNMTNADAKWIFRWTTPYYHTEDRYLSGIGTLVIVS